MITRDSPPSSSSVRETRAVCRVCQKQFAQYTCPRCNSRYCSLQCYKGHGLRCTESFMRENVLEEMKQMQPKNETKLKMMEILKRFQLEEEMDQEEEEDSTISEETIQKYLSGQGVRLRDLSAKEVKLFQRAVASGELSKMIQPWEPWWLKPSAKTVSLSKDGSQLVRPVDEHMLEISEEVFSGDNLCEIPPGPDTALPPLNELRRSDPSPLLAVHVVDILYSYCFTLRFYNGDWHCDPSGAATVVLSISSVLGEGAQPETVPEAFSSCMEKTCSPPYRHAGGFSFGLGLVDDVITLLSLGTNALICLLCDLRRLIIAGDKRLKLEKKQQIKPDDSRSKFKSAEKKLYFLTCWVHEQPGEAWSSTEAIARAERAYLLAIEKEHKYSKMETKRVPEGNILIEEV